MMLGKLTAEDATALSKRVKASRLVIIAVDDEGYFSIAMAGEPGEHEEAAREWGNKLGEGIAASLGRYRSGET